MAEREELSHQQFIAPPRLPKSVFANWTTRFVHCKVNTISYHDNMGFHTMTKFLISFPASAMDVAAEEMVAVGEAARTVIREAKRAGIYVFGGGLNSEVAPQLVSADGNCTSETYRQTRELDGGFCVLELPSREAAVRWAAKLAAACRCEQELREFHYDPES